MEKNEAKMPSSRRIAGNCRIGFLVLHEVETGLVYYVSTNSSPSERILTEFTADDINSNQRFPPSDSDFLQWDKGNSEGNETHLDFYTVQGK
jgi:hypothetical protein